MYGQLADGTSLSYPLASYRTTPAPISGNIAFQKLSVKEAHVCGLTGSGEIYCWGWNGFGQLGNGVVEDGRSTPQLVRKP
jgi:alpha-tubulin suppressor-like RCC1 family protein